MLQRSPDSFRETPEFRFGRTGEQFVAQELQRRGWYVIPSYDFCGEEGNKAPKLQGGSTRFVIPDLDISQAGMRRWVEVKAKDAATYTRITDRLEHGIAARHWRDYLEVENITGCEVWLAIYERDTGDVLIQSITKLRGLNGGPRNSMMKKNGDCEGAMVYFPRSAFIKMFNTGQPRGHWTYGTSLEST